MKVTKHSIILLLFLFLLSPVSSFGRIGESISECENHYGNNVGSQEVSERLIVNQYRKGHRTLVIFFLDGKAEGISYRNVKAPEIAQFLENNNQGHKWKGTAIELWKRTDGQLYATYHKDQKSLFIFSAKMVEENILGALPSYEAVGKTAKGYIFKPPGSEYTVTFPSTPRSYSFDKEDAGGRMLKGHGAELATENPDVLLRAESIYSGPINTDSITKEAVILIMRQLALDLGVSRPNYKYEVNELGKVGILWGIKDTEHGRMTAKIINYCDRESVLTLYLMSRSKDFETEEMVKFRKSVRRR